MTAVMVEDRRGQSRGNQLQGGESENRFARRFNHKT